METKTQYAEYKKPSWAPPSWLFGPVWTVLYILIAISFGHVGIAWYQSMVPTLVALPFVLNLIFNFLFTPIQFRLRNFTLAAIDIVLVWATLVWALVAIWPIAPWVALINLPYLAWVSFATALQLTITSLNRR